MIWVGLKKNDKKEEMIARTIGLALQNGQLGQKIWGSV